MRAVATGFDLYESISPDDVVDLPRFTMNKLLTYEIYVGSLGDVTAVRQDGVPVKFVAVPAGTLLTRCVLTLQNGFTVTGESACASAENFDAEIGKRVAREDAKRKIWPLLGYELRSQLAKAGS